MVKAKIWTLQEEETTRIMYNSGMSITEIAGNLCSSTYPVRYKLRCIRKRCPSRIIGWRQHHSILMQRAWIRGVFDHMQGETHPNWAGDKVKSVALHVWIRRHKHKPDFCEICGERPPFDLANISGEYKRDINDFQWICRKCHMVLDGRLEKLHQAVLKRVSKNKELTQGVV